MQTVSRNVNMQHDLKWQTYLGSSFAATVTHTIHSVLLTWYISNASFLSLLKAWQEDFFTFSYLKSLMYCLCCSVINLFFLFPIKHFTWQNFVQHDVTVIRTLFNMMSQLLCSTGAGVTIRHLNQSWRTMLMCNQGACFIALRRQVCHVPRIVHDGK